jgi:hypothetical protein
VTLQAITSTVLHTQALAALTKLSQHRWAGSPASHDACNAMHYAAAREAAWPCGLRRRIAAQCDVALFDVDWCGVQDCSKGSLYIAHGALLLCCRRGQSAMVRAGALDWALSYLSGGVGGGLDGSRRASDEAEGGSVDAESAAASRRASEKEEEEEDEEEEEEEGSGPGGDSAEASRRHSEEAGSSARPGQRGAAAAGQLLPDACLEYGAALMLNLCLRSAGKAWAGRRAGALLRLCCLLLEHHNDQVSV